MDRERTLVRYIVPGRWLMGCTALGLALGIVILLISAPRYEARAVLVPSANVPRTTRVAGDGLAGVLGSGLTAGLGLATDNMATPFDQYRYLLRSRAVAARLFQDQPLMRELFRSEWDPGTRRWRMSSGIVSHTRGLIRALFRRPAYLPPSPERLEEYLRERVTVLQADPPFTVVSYRNRDPQIAGALLAGLLRETTAAYRQGVIDESREEIAYILDQLPTVKVDQQRKALAALLSDEEFNLMLVDSKVPIAAATIDPVAVSDEPVSPRIPLTLALATLLGAVIGMALQLLPPHLLPGGSRLGADSFAPPARNQPAEG